MYDVRRLSKRDTFKITSVLFSESRNVRFSVVLLSCVVFCVEMFNVCVDVLKGVFLSDVKASTTS